MSLFGFLKCGLRFQVTNFECDDDAEYKEDESYYDAASSHYEKHWLVTKRGQILLESTGFDFREYQKQCYEGDSSDYETFEVEEPSLLVGKDVSCLRTVEKAHLKETYEL